LINSDLYQPADETVDHLLEALAKARRVLDLVRPMPDPLTPAAQAEALRLTVELADHARDAVTTAEVIQEELESMIGS
jgi:hypothetical protein